MAKKVILPLFLIIIISFGAGCGEWLSPFGALTGTVYPGAEPAAALPDPGISSLSLSLTPDKRTTLSPDIPAKTDSLIVTCNSKLSESEQQQSLKSMGFEIIRQLYSDSNTYVVKPINTTNLELSYRASLNTGSIQSVEYNFPVKALTTTPNDEFYQSQPRQWDMMVSKFNVAWDNYKGQDPVVVAILDTGINVDSPELCGRMAPPTDWKDFVDDDQNPREPYLGDPNSLERYSHGTNVAGIIGAKPDNGLGYAGAAWDENKIKILPVRVLDTYGNGSIGDITDGIYWAVDHNAKVINLSLGASGGYNSDLFNKAVAYAASHNVTLVCASGNEGDNPNTAAVNYPARLAKTNSNVIAVGATGYSNLRAYYSCYGPELTVVAPGGDPLVGSSNTQQYIWNITYDKYNQNEVYDIKFAGTSMATPHVSALAALLYSYGVIDATRVRELISYTATDLGTGGWDNLYGYGLINAYAALLGATCISSVTVGLRDPTTLKDVTAQVHPDRNGEYKFSKIAAGNYELYGRYDLPNGSKYEGAVPVTVTTSGTLFTVTKKNIILPLIPN